MCQTTVEKTHLLHKGMYHCKIVAISIGHLFTTTCNEETKVKKKEAVKDSFLKK